MAPSTKPAKVPFPFTFQPAQKRLFHYVQRGAGTYLQLTAPQTLEVGGIRSGKTTGKLLFFVQNYCMKFSHCDILVLRRTFSELESGVIQDFKTHVPKDLYDYNQQAHIATFTNGSRCVFAGCIRGGTLIDTARGLVPIENVTLDDEVLTRKGFRRVLWSGMTGIKKTYRVENTWLTEDHNVYCNGEFIPVQEILCRRASGKTARLLIRRSSYSRVSSIVDTQTPNVNGIEIISPDGGARSNAHFMWQSTKAFTGRFLRDLKSTIETKILSTTIPITWASLAGVPTENFTSPTSILQSQFNARFVLRNSQPNIPTNERPALNLVGEFISLALGECDRNPSSLVPVYDLTVDGEHEFFANGILVHNCVNNKERDIEKYLGQSYAGILVDECGQFSPNAWELLYSRNTVNAACEPDEYGNFPIPSIAGCTNPLGPYWEYYHSKFVLKEPWEKEEGCRKAKDGSWWAPDAGTWRCIYDPADYASNHTTVLDNPAYIRERDPGIIARLKALPKAKMQKMLLGLMDRVEGQFFDCFSEEQHVIDLREDSESIIWQDWQPVWGGQDFGVGHWNAIYLFTKALVRDTIGADYKIKTVCFQEIAPEQTGQTNIILADMLAAKAYYPRLPQDHPLFERISGKPCKVRAIYFSHEKFSRIMEAHSPADDYSRILRARGLPSVSRATMDRIGSASFLYNLFKNGKIVILRTCPGIIQAIPALQRNPDNLDDVLKVDSKADDRYDAFRYGLYGMLSDKAKPQEEKDREYADTLSPFQRHFYLKKANAINSKRSDSFVQEAANIWEGKI